MKELTRKAYAKINLTLDVTGKRADGYHEIRTIMQTINLYDEVTLIKEAEPGIRFITDCAEVPADENNLVYQAADYIIQRFQIREGVRIHLKKNIPIAAGLAGGSTDGAAVFHGMNELFGLGIAQDDLCAMGTAIGADVPFCILGGCALAEGIGEKLIPLSPPPDCHIVLVKPNVSVSTRAVYERLDAVPLTYHPDTDGMLAAIQARDLAGMADRMDNVLETVTIAEHPVIRMIKVQMMALGAENALMSGSGPTVFGIFADALAARKALAELRRIRMERVILTAFVS